MRRKRRPKEPRPRRPRLPNEQPRRRLQWKRLAQNPAKGQFLPYLGVPRRLLAVKSTRTQRKRAQLSKVCRQLIRVNTELRQSMFLRGARLAAEAWVRVILRQAPPQTQAPPRSHYHGLRRAKPPGL